MMGVGWSNKELLSIHKAAVRKPPLLLGKKDETIKKNKGKPSGLFNHLIYFCKKRQNKIMHRIRSPVRADLHVRKLRPVVFQKPLLFMDIDQIGRTGCFLGFFFSFFTPFFTASAPVQCLQLTCTTGRICVRGCRNALIHSVQSSLICHNF